MGLREQLIIGWAHPGALFDENTMRMSRRCLFHGAQHSQPPEFTRTPPTNLTGISSQEIRAKKQPMLGMGISMVYYCCQK